MPSSATINTLAVSRRPGRPKGFDSTCRDKLLAVALSSFACHGFDGVSLRTIASAAGFDVSMLAHHFGSKADLWHAVVDEVAKTHQALQMELNELKSTDQPLVRRVTSVLDRMVEHLANQPETIMFITREISVPGERLDYLIEQLIRPGFDVCVPLWREAMDEGLLRPSNPVVLHMGLFSAVAMILSSRHIIVQLGGGDISIEQLKTEIHISLLGNTPPKSYDNTITLKITALVHHFSVVSSSQLPIPYCPFPIWPKTPYSRRVDPPSKPRTIHPTKK